MALLQSRQPVPNSQTRRRFSLKYRGGTLYSLAAASLVILFLVAVFAPAVAPYDPLAANPIDKFLPPLSSGHILGTDELGRDILSRLIYGARIALFLAVVPTLIALVVGGLIGLLAGYCGGVVDAVIMRVFDVMFAFPGILLALGISAALGAGFGSMLTAMVVVAIPEFGRLVRGCVLTVKENLYVEAARTLGLSNIKIALRHVLPNLRAPIIVMTAMQTGNNVILGASLSFLGLGAQPPTPDWGAMLDGGKSAMLNAPHVATIAGLAIVYLTICFNLVGDAVRDRFDPSSTNR
ncbi:ABC transporter permease [Rhodococcus sp. ABRD24]|nr:ABC transporter permease [Rhodococcus sp. ABRD24]